MLYWAKHAIYKVNKSKDLCNINIEESSKPLYSGNR